MEILKNLKSKELYIKIVSIFSLLSYFSILFLGKYNIFPREHIDFREFLLYVVTSSLCLLVLLFKKTIRLDKLSILLFLIFFLQSLPMVYHPLNSSTFGYGIKLGNLFIILIFLLNIKDKYLEIIHLSLIFAGSLFTLIFLFDYLQESKHITGMISFSGHIICLNAIVALYFRTENHFYQVLKYSIVLIALYLLFTTQRRLELVQLLVVSVIYISFRLKNLSFKLKMTSIGLVLTLAITFTFSTSSSHYKYKSILNFFKNPTYKTLNSASTDRAELALTGIDIISKNPLRGIGFHGRSLNNFSSANLDSFYLHSHNEIIQQAVQGGILNVIFQLLLLTALIFLVIRATNSSNNLNNISTIGLVTCFLNWLFTRHYIDPISRIYFIFFFCLLIKKFSPPKFNINKLAIGAIGIISVFILSSIFIAKTYEKKALYSHNFGKKLKNTNIALSYDSYSPRVLYNYVKMCLSIRKCNKKYLINFYNIYPDHYLSNLGQYYLSPKENIHFWSNALEKAPKDKKEFVEKFLIK